MRDEARHQIFTSAYYLSVTKHAPDGAKEMMPFEKVELHTGDDERSAKN